MYGCIKTENLSLACTKVQFKLFSINYLFRHFRNFTMLQNKMTTVNYVIHIFTYERFSYSF